MKTIFLAGLALTLAGCISTPNHAQLARAEPVFSPAAFFSGRTRGQATLKVLLSAASQVVVVGEGTVEPDGTLVLVQRIERAGVPTENRTWRIRPTSAGRYGGTLTSADGPVAGDVSGNLLHLRFTAEGGLDTEQWLYLQPGGRVALNRMVVRKFGLPVAALEETISKD